MEALRTKAARSTASRLAHSPALSLLKLAAEGYITLHIMPRSCRRFDLPKAGRVAIPTLVVIGGSLSPARPGDFPAAGAALRWARVAIIYSPGDTSADYAEIGAALIQHRTAVLIETAPVLESDWQALAASAQRHRMLEASCEARDTTRHTPADGGFNAALKQ
jgi:hypothetical protein